MYLPQSKGTTLSCTAGCADALESQAPTALKNQLHRNSATGVQRDVLY